MAQKDIQLFWKVNKGGVKLHLRNGIWRLRSKSQWIYKEEVSAITIRVNAKILKFRHRDSMQEVLRGIEAVVHIITRPKHNCRVDAINLMWPCCCWNSWWKFLCMRGGLGELSRKPRWHVAECPRVPLCQHKLRPKPAEPTVDDISRPVFWRADLSRILNRQLGKLWADKVELLADGVPRVRERPRHELVWNDVRRDDWLQEWKQRAELWTQLAVKRPNC